MTSWIAVPRETLLTSPAEPYLADQSSIPGLRAMAESRGASWCEVDVRGVRNSADFIDRLKAELPFPGWCGSGWDSVDDAFEEIRAEWPFPLFLRIVEMRWLLTEHPHAGMQTAIRLDELSRSFSRTGHQLTVIYSDPSWRRMNSRRNAARHAV